MHCCRRPAAVLPGPGGLRGAVGWGLVHGPEVAAVRGRVLDVPTKLACWLALFPEQREFFVGLVIGDGDLDGRLVCFLCVFVGDLFRRCGCSSAEEMCPSSLVWFRRLESNCS